MEYRKISPELKAFEDAWKTLDWTALTANQKQAHIVEHYRLQIESAKWVVTTDASAEAQAVIDAETRRQQAITYLTGRGFACDNSLADWQKLYNRPKIFGDNHNAQAVYQFGLNKGLNYFLQTAYSLWLEYTHIE